MKQHIVVIFYGTVVLCFCTNYLLSPKKEADTCPISRQAASTGGQDLQPPTEKVSPEHSAPKSHVDSLQVSKP